MTVGQIFTKISNFIENRQIFMLLNCNCAKLANFEDFKTCRGPFFVHTVYKVIVQWPGTGNFDSTPTGGITS